MTHEPQRTRQDETPLEGWKEIAVYLGRTERTAKLWEKEERLPVHRQQHKLRPSVYAYPSELDAWRAARQPGAAATPVPLWRRPLPSAALAGLLLLSLLTVGNGPYFGSVMAAGMVTRQVWAGPEGNLYGAASYDGRYLSYMNWVDVFVRDLRSGENRNLTKYGSLAKAAGFPESSMPSRDGTQVAYTWYPYSAPGYEVRVVGLDGSEPRILIPNEGASWNAVSEWSPDGKHILATIFRKADSKPQIALVSTSDGGVRVLKTLDRGYSREMSFSPDGRYIAYDRLPRRESEDRDIFVLAIDGSGEIPLVEHPADDFVLGWAPDGSGVLFASNRTSNRAAWFIRVSEGRPQGSPVLVKPNLPEPIWPLGFTQDGAYYYGVDTTRRDVYLTTLDPETGEALAQPSKVHLRLVGNISHLAWSPDGRSLAYLFQPFQGTGVPRVTLSVLDVQTREERQFNLALFVPRWAALRWSPDGSSLLLVGVKEAGPGLYRVDPGTGETTVVVKGEPQAVVWADWSPDGKGIYHGAGRILFRDLRTGQEKELHRRALSAPPAPDLSPDGRQLAFATRDPATGLAVLMLMPVDGGEPHELFKSAEPGAIRSIAWTPDARYLLFAQRDELWRIPVEGGEPQELGIAMEGLQDIHVHPDGRRIALTALDPSGGAEIWVMENFLREVRGNE